MIGLAEDLCAMRVHRSAVHSYSHVSSHVICFLHCSVDTRTNQAVAIKIVDLEELCDEIEDIQQETAVLSQCDSPYIIQYFGSYIKVCLS